MADPTLVHLIASLILALLGGTWQPAPADLVATAPQPVQFSAVWHPANQIGNEQDLVVIGADGTVLGGATSSAVSSPKH
jgi:hypothetical protein